ncbi:MAG: cation:proton antiporter [Bacteroidetes bacterium]|nr:MAG: cation:proton antiporter [Bacteroidota bacterium]
MEFLKITGAILSLIGSLFILFAAIGLLRMPDIYNRIQAGTKATTLGSMLTLLGVGLVHPDWLMKIILLIVFVMISNPVSSHVLGRAAHFIGIPLSDKTNIDALKEDRQKAPTSKEKES